jgi:hypothetical protein
VISASQANGNTGMSHNVWPCISLFCKLNLMALSEMIELNHLELEKFGKFSEEFSHLEDIERMETCYTILHILDGKI